MTIVQLWCQRVTAPVAPWVAHTWLAELWDYRDLLFFWTRRELVARYRQTWLGASWALVQPVGYTGAFWYCIGRFSSTAIPYPLYGFVGSVVWLFFSKSVLGASAGLVGHSKLVTQVYFPRLTIPLSTILSNLVDLLIGLVACCVLSASMGLAPSWKGLAMLPILVLSLAMLAFGLSALLGAWHVRYRDVGYALQFFMQLWFFLSPVMYSFQSAGAFYWCNPMVGFLSAFRSAISGTACDVQALGASWVWSISLLIIGTHYFRELEHDFADVI